MGAIKWVGAMLQYVFKHLIDHGNSITFVNSVEAIIAIIQLFKHILLISDYDRLYKVNLGTNSHIFK